MTERHAPVAAPTAPSGFSFHLSRKPCSDAVELTEGWRGSINVSVAVRTDCERSSA